MTVIQMLTKRIEIHTAQMSSSTERERSELAARIAEDRNLIFILTANTDINSVE